MLKSETLTNYPPKEKKRTEEVMGEEWRGECEVGGFI